MAAQLLIHRHDRSVIGPLGRALTLGAWLLLSRNFWLEPAERAEKFQAEPKMLD